MVTEYLILGAMLGLLLALLVTALFVLAGWIDGR